MSSIPIFVGLDYHKDSVHVCALDREGKQLLNRDCVNEVELAGWFVGSDCWRAKYSKERFVDDFADLTLDELSGDAAS